jgi:DNA-binding transcriptional MerR regulator
MAEAKPSHLSIGEVLGLLLEEFPDITISKIRFLESQGLIEPERTPSGYRKFYEHDVELLRVILREQREHFLPLRVIKDRIDAGVIEATGTPPHGSASPERPSSTPSAAAIAKHPAAGRNSSAAPSAPPAAAPPAAAKATTGQATTGQATTGQTTTADTAAEDPTPASQPRPTRDTSPRLLPGVVVSREELCAMASITSAQLASLEEYGVIARRKGGSDLYSEDAVEIAAAAGGLLRAGIDARHLRAWRTSVEREVGLYAQLVMPILRQRNPDARSQASAQLAELNEWGSKLRNALAHATVRDQLDL